MGEVLDELCVIAGEYRAKLEALDRSGSGMFPAIDSFHNAANRNIMNCEAGSSTDRSRTSITSNLRKRQRELAVNFQGLGQRFQEDQRVIVEMHLFTVIGQKYDESVIERLIETGDNESIFQNAILTQGRDVVLVTIAEIQERRDAVKDIEKKLLDLHQIFLHTGILVEAQAERGELDDNIDGETCLLPPHTFSSTKLWGSDAPSSKPTLHPGAPEAANPVKKLRRSERVEDHTRAECPCRVDVANLPDETTFPRMSVEEFSESILHQWRTQGWRDGEPIGALQNFKMNHQ